MNLPEHDLTDPKCLIQYKNVLEQKKKREESREYVIAAGEDIKALRELAYAKSKLLGEAWTTLSELYNMIV